MTPTTSSAKAEMIMKPPNSVVTWLCIESMSRKIMTKTGGKVLPKKELSTCEGTCSEEAGSTFFYLIFIAFILI